MALYLDGKKYKITLNSNSTSNVVTKEEQEKTLDITTNGTYTVEPDEGKVLSSATVNVNVSSVGKEEQEKTLNVTVNGEYDITPDDGKVISLAKVNVNVPIPDGYIQPSGELAISENGTYDVTNYASTVVNVEGGGGWTFEEMITPNGLDGDLIYNGTNFNTQVVANLFSYRTGITSVVMENYTGSLPSFRNCSSLSYMYFPKVTSLIGQGLNTTGFSGTLYMNKMTPAITKLSAGSCFNNMPNVTRIILPATITTVAAQAFNSGLSQCADICFLGTPTSLPTNTFVGTNTIATIQNIYVPWAEGEVANAPWGATNATIHYNTTFDENGDPIVMEV